MKSILALSVLLPLALCEPTVYLIRHGEKAGNGSNYLSAQGQQRANCLPNVFGTGSTYDIGHIMAEDPKSSGSEQRPYDTVIPLSKNLGLSIDTSCSRDDSDCVAQVVDNYSGTGNILICWEHKYLSNIVTALGDSGTPPVYPGNDYGVIWTDPAPYTGITHSGDEDCPGLGQ